MKASPAKSVGDRNGTGGPGDVSLPWLMTVSRALDGQISLDGGHSRRVAEWAVSTARKMGKSSSFTWAIHWAGIFHDVGKVIIPSRILRKPGPLSPSEWAEMRFHPTAGSNIISASKSLRPVASLVQAHHEWFDGRGYPNGLRGEEIPLGSRILSVADAYDAMTNDRVYRKGRSQGEALQELRICAGLQFDPRVVDMFIDMF